MTIADFLSDRLGRIVLQGGCAAASALFLLATGTQPGVVALLLMGLILVFVLAQLWECVRLRRRLAELKAVMEGLDQKQLFAECAPKPEGLWERELFALMHQSGQAMVGAVSEAQAAQREYREYVEQWVHEIKTPITAARLISRTVGPDTRRRLERELAQMRERKDYAARTLREQVPGLELIGAGTAPHILPVTLPGDKSEVVLRFLSDRGIYVSSGSACHKGKPSHVYAALKLPKPQLDGILRISFSYDTAREAVDALVQGLTEAQARLFTSLSGGARQTQQPHNQA